MLVLATSELFVTMFTGAAQAASSDTTIYQITCVSLERVNAYLDYGINAITITNPNARHSAESLYISDSAGSSAGSSQEVTYQKRAINQARHDRYTKVIGLLVSRQNG